MIVRPLALFDLDHTLLDYGGAINVWADEFIAHRNLAVKRSTYLVFAVWYQNGRTCRLS
jgi:phosphoserine phosphatase